MFPLLFFRVADEAAGGLSSLLWFIRQGGNQPLVVIASALVAGIGATWFETHGVAVLLTMRVKLRRNLLNLILRSGRSPRLEGWTARRLSP